MFGRESEGVLCALPGIVVVVWGLLSGVSCTSNSESHVDEGSPLFVSVLGGTRLSRVHSHRAAAAAVVHDEEESRSRRIQSSPR